MSAKPKASVRLLKARRAASKELSLPLDHWAVKRTALLTIAHQNLEAALVDGHRVDISDLLKVEAALNEVKAALPKEAIKVELMFVDGKTGNSSTDIKELYPPESKSAPKQIEGAVETNPAEPPIDKPEVKAEAPAPAPAPAPPPVRQGISGSAFHDQVLGNEVAPLKRTQSGPYHSAAQGSLCWTESRWSLESGRSRWATDDPNPNRNAAHPLPTPTNGKGS